MSANEASLGTFDPGLDNAFEQFGPVDVDAFIDSQFNYALEGQEELQNTEFSKTAVGSRNELQMAASETSTLHSIEFSLGGTQTNLDKANSFVSSLDELQMSGFSGMCSQCHKVMDKKDVVSYQTRKCETKERTFDPRSAIATELQLSEISDDVGTCWRKLGPKLNIAAAKIHNLDEDYKNNHDKANALLLMWKQQEGNSHATVGRLADHLKAIGRTSIAEKLLGVADVQLPTCSVEKCDVINLTVKCDLNGELDSKEISSSMIAGGTQRMISTLPLEIRTGEVDSELKGKTKEEFKEKIAIKIPAMKEESSSKKMTTTETVELQPPAESSSRESTDSKRGTEKSEEGVSPKSKAAPLWTKTISVSSVITREGGTVAGEGVKLVCPPGAVERSVTVTVTLEDPAKYYGFLVQSDLENDVMFCAAIINLQPNGLFFEGPVELTVSLAAKISSFDEVVILHGMQTTPTTIVWRDITHNAIRTKQTDDELLITTERFSVIGAFIKKTFILTKDIVCRLNLSSFNYSLLVLFNETYIPNQLALVFVSEDVKNEAFFKEDEKSVLAQLKRERFREIMVRSTEEQNDRRIYNQEELKVSVCLGEDYKCSSSELRVVVDSTSWWSTGHAIKVPLELENTKQVRILCGRITITGEYENRKERKFCELDLHGYVKGFLGVNGEVFNVIPIAEALTLPEKILHEIKEKWSDDECQLEVIVHWLKQTDVFESLAFLRKALQGLKQDYRVTTKRGEMHVKHIRYFAKKIGGLEHESVECERYFASKVRALCLMLFRDCCLQMERTADGLEIAASSTNHVSYITFRMQRKIPDCFVQGCKEICSSSQECRIIEKFKGVVPELIQIIKEVFVDDETDREEQNGLWGISGKTLATFSSSIGDARRENSVTKLMCDVSQILETLCLKNCSDKWTSKVKRWGKGLANLAMLEFLKPFFQNCPKNRRLHKRLELFFERTREIFLNQMEFADEVFLQDFANVSLSLVDFAKYDASKLVKFVVSVDSPNSPVNFTRENTQYDRDSFFQTVYVKKESEGELKLRALASVHISGQIHKIGAFQSVIMLRESGWESFEKCRSPFHRVTTTTVKDKDSDNLRVVLCSFQKQDLSEMLKVLGSEMSEELIDLTKSQVTHCPLTLTARNISAKAGKVLSLRLIYKWGSDSLDLESEDFVICADSSAQSTSFPQLRLFGHESTAAQLDEAAATQDNPFPLASADGNFNFPLSQPSSQRPLIQCHKVEYHYNQYNTTMQGHNCFVGDKPTLHNNPMPAQGAIEETQGTSPRLSLTDEK